jgi:hypothetical protein
MTAPTASGYGSYTLNLPTTDSTGLVIPDVLNYSMSGSYLAVGTMYLTKNPWLDGFLPATRSEGWCFVA